MNIKSSLQAFPFTLLDFIQLDYYYFNVTQLNSFKNNAVVLSGGGARGAYQVGVLSAINDILNKKSLPNPFDTYTGVSAGAINATHMAAHNNDFNVATSSLVKLWSHLDADKVFKSDALNLGKIGLQWMSELSFGGITGTTPGRALLDTSPLNDLLKNNLPIPKILQNISNKNLKALALTAVDYKSSEGVTFVQGQADLKMWQKARRHSELDNITVDHVMASAAIPLLFPPIKVGSRFFGDGCIRNTHPCSPAIHLGSQKLLIIGVRKEDPENVYSLEKSISTQAPSVARVMNTLLNAILLDGIEADVEKLEQMNQFARSLKDNKTRYQPIDYVWISPSGDIGALAAQRSRKLPRLIRYLLKGLGSIEEASEIVSYLLFETSFCSELIEMGYQDGLKQQEQFLKVFAKEFHG